MALTDKLTAIGNAIRAKKGTTDKYTLEGMVTAIDGIETGIDTSDATAAAEDIVKNKTAYVNGTKVTGTLESGAIANLTKFVSDPSADILVRFEGAALTDGYVKADEYDVKLNVERDLAYALFGYATPADVAKGKTFTSGLGIKQTGTKEEAVAPSGSISITENGTYDVTDKAQAVVNVPQSGGEEYAGDYRVIPKFTEKVLQTKNKLMKDNVSISPIEVTRVSNPSGGTTVYIGGITNG